jgi:hypothetical protein
MREVLLDFLIGPNQYRSTAASLQRYFDAFAMAAVRRPPPARSTPGDERGAGSDSSPISPAAVEGNSP